MPNKSSSIKDLRKSKKRRAHNLRIRTNVKQTFNQAQVALKQGDETRARDLIKSFQKAADKAAKKRVISPNKANRKKSVLMKALKDKDGG
jgi:ribosomal protein S20